MPNDRPGGRDQRPGTDRRPLAGRRRLPEDHPRCVVLELVAIGANFRGKDDGPYDTAEQVAELMDQLRDQAANDAPIIAMVYLYDTPEDESPLLQIGVGIDKGWATYGKPYQDQGFTSYGGGGNEIVYYCFQGTQSEFPAWAEIPFETLKKAVIEFMESGGERPTAPTWRSADELDQWMRTPQQQPR